MRGSNIPEDMLTGTLEERVAKFQACMDVMVWPSKDPIKRFYDGLDHGGVFRIYARPSKYEFGEYDLCECYQGRRETAPNWIVWAPWDQEHHLRLALKLGIVKPARGQICVDCGRAATVLEHRHSKRPLDVDPTCHRCNLRRGPPDDKNDGTRTYKNKKIPRKPSGHVRYAFRDSMIEAATEPLE